MQADELADVLVAKQSGLTAMKLQKLLYYVQGWHLAITGEPLFEEDFKGYADGPVLVSVWRARQDPTTRRHQAATLPTLTPEAEKIVQLVLTEYGGRSGDELSALSHSERPWQEARVGLREGERGSRPVTKESMTRFFRDERRLGNRTAADLTSGGMYIADPNQEVDVRSLIEEFSSSWPEDTQTHQGDMTFWPLDEIDHRGIEVPELA